MVERAMDLNQVVGESVRGAVGQVFSTMIGVEAVNDPALDDYSPPPFSVSGVCGNVSFAGRFTGAVYFSLAPELAAEITAKIIGEDRPAKESEINDVIGELTNMITGNLKSKMSDAGYNCQLSIPSIMRGEGIRVSAKGSGIWVAKRFELAELSASFSVRVIGKVDTKDGK